MAESNNARDQRKYDRHSIELGAFAVFSDDESLIPGRVIDISMGGIAFFYFDGEEWPNESSEIFKLFGEDFYMENVPLEIISDTIIDDRNHPIYKTMGEANTEGRKIRRRGVKFGKLSKDQKEQLETFLKENDIVDK
ncbi:MAG: PilZ domain-containing protein [Desulfobulbaceae bacterium]|uniref:PilZ domain-containing protein n=1 Tax=Candidatus Desulfobia pelagia TaxID=2841692 RepID=A0A8J6NCU6_9BACT|nr:PilZ domain-containing protein [Candidatus Desulfobia pelagia]